MKRPPHTMQVPSCPFQKSITFQLGAEKGIANATVRDGGCLLVMRNPALAKRSLMEVILYALSTPIIFPLT